MSTDLPHRQQQLYNALAGRGDVLITEVAKALEADLERLNCAAPQWLSPYITKLNRRLVKRGLAVKPGVTKGTLRLIVL